MLPKRKKSSKITFYFQEIFSQERKLLVDIVNLCMHVRFWCPYIMPINCNLQLPPKKNNFFPYTNWHFCNVYCLVPNICYRTNIRQNCLDEYSFSAETRKSVFGRSLFLIEGLSSLLLMDCVVTSSSTALYAVVPEEDVACLASESRSWFFFKTIPRLYFSGKFHLLWPLQLIPVLTCY
jgi:hypothetical protein